MRLHLRPLVLDDVDALRRIASDPVRWEQHPSKDRGEEAAFRAWFDDALGEGALVAVDRASGEVIGTSRYAVRSDDVVEIGRTFLARSRWGLGWNGELKRLMLDHAFASVSTVLFAVHEDNLRSQRAVLRLGAERVRTSPDAHGCGQNVLCHLRRQPVD